MLGLPPINESLRKSRNANASTVRRMGNRNCKNSQ